MKKSIYVLVIVDHENESVDSHLFTSKRKALQMVAGDIADRNHFDTDEPYCTKRELRETIKKVKNALEKDGWHNDGEVLYQLDEKTVA